MIVKPGLYICPFVSVTGSPSVSSILSQSIHILIFFLRISNRCIVLQPFNPPSTIYHQRGSLPVFLTPPTSPAFSSNFSFLPLFPKPVNLFLSYFSFVLLLFVCFVTFVIFYFKLANYKIIIQFFLTRESS